MRRETTLKVMSALVALLLVTTVLIALRGRIALAVARGNGEATPQYVVIQDYMSDRFEHKLNDYARKGYRLKGFGVQSSIDGAPYTAVMEK